MIRLYPKVTICGQSFKGVKRQTVPKLSMSLREILNRFVRREPLPVAREGVYEERFGDLEKISKADITEQMEKVEELKTDIALFKMREKKKRDKAIEDSKLPVPPVPAPPPVPGI